MNTSIKKCIVFTCYNRPEYLKQTLNQWKKVKKLNEYDIHFSIDYSKEHFKDIYKLILDFCEEKKFYIKINRPKLGVLKNTYSILNYVFENNYEFVVIAEDDTLPSIDILSFFEFCNEYYLNKDNILCSCAYSKVDNDNPKYLTLKPTFDSWLWAISKDKWTLYLKDNWDFDYSFGGWDNKIRNIIMPNNHLYSVYSKNCRVEHIGQIGTHMTSEMHQKQNIFLNSDEIFFEEER
jgi:hypothetical protein